MLVVGLKLICDDEGLYRFLEKFFGVRHATSLWMFVT